MKEEAKELSVVTLPEVEMPAPLDSLRSPFDNVRQVANLTNLKLDELAIEINEFLAKLDQVFKETHTMVADYKLVEINVSAGITAGGKVTLFGIAGAEAGVSGGLSFKLKKE